MAWYRTGTLSVINGSATVTGLGTNWISQQQGWVLVTSQSSDLYEVSSIVSSTELTLTSTFAGATAATLNYFIVPTQSLNADLVVKINEMITIFNNTKTSWDLVFADFSSSVFDSWLTQPGNAGLTYQDFLDDITGPQGIQGISAYQVWLDAGNSGTVTDFLNDISADAISATSANVTAAQASETNASTSETNASTSETNAGNSETAALGAQTATEALFDQFGDQYLGSKATNPTLDNDGDPLTDGDIYFNTTDEVLKFYSGTAWIAPESIASTAATAAQTAQTAAEFAQTGAETAQTASQSAQIATELAEAGAVAAQGGAETAETNAVAAEANTQTLRDEVLSRFIGNYANDAGANASGFTISQGIFYWNTTSLGLRIHDGSTWGAAVLSLGGALTVANNFSDLGHVPTALTNLGLGTAATTDSTDYATAAQGTLADNALPITGGTLTGNLTISNASPALNISETDNGAEHRIISANGILYIQAQQSGAASNNGRLVLSGRNAVDLARLDIDAAEAIFSVDGVGKMQVDVNGATITGDLDVTGTVDGRDVSVDGTKLDGIDPADYATAAQGTLAGSAVQPTSTETLTNKTLTDPVIVGCITDEVYTITDGAGFQIDPSNGAIQQVTLGSNRTPAATNFANGETITLRISDGSSRTITWSTVGVVWAGGSAPTLATSGFTEINLQKAGGVIRGTHVGDFAS
jgi:hypothetical protein